MQPGRPFIIGAVCCDKLIEFIYTNPELQLKQSGLVELNITKPTGIQMLLNLISSNSHQLGYSSPEDHKVLISTTGFTYKSLLRRADNRRESLVLFGSINSKKAIFKASNNLNNELKMLGILKECKYVSQVVKEGFLSDGRMFMVITPAGVHLEAKKHGLKVTLKALRDVAKTLKFSYDRHIFHHDVSYLNIIVYEKQGYLIDWGVASTVSELISAPLTGTYLFSSFLVLMSFKTGKPHVYSIIDEIESLFYVFIYIACDGIVSWKKNSDLSTSIAIKYNVMFCPQEFNRHLTNYAHNEFHTHLSAFHKIIFPYGTDLESRELSIEEIIEIFENWINEL